MFYQVRNRRIPTHLAGKKRTDIRCSYCRSTTIWSPNRQDRAKTLHSFLHIGDGFERSMAENSPCVCPNCHATSSMLISAGRFNWPLRLVWLTGVLRAPGGGDQLATSLLWTIVADVFDEEERYTYWSAFTRVWSLVSTDV